MIVFKIVYAFTDVRFHRVRLSPEIELELALWDKYATNSQIILFYALWVLHEYRFQKMYPKGVLSSSMATVPMWHVGLIMSTS